MSIDEARRSGTSEKLEDLLTPGLQGETGALSIYSTRASFFVALLGGPFAILLFSALNSRRLGRLARDAGVLGFGAVATIALIVVASQQIEAGVEPSWLSWLGDGRRGLRAAVRVFSLLLFGLVYLSHRRFHKAQDLRGQAPPSPWAAAIACTLAGGAASVLIVAVTVGAGA